MFTRLESSTLTCGETLILDLDVCVCGLCVWWVCKCVLLSTSVAFLDYVIWLLKSEKERSFQQVGNNTRVCYVCFQGNLQSSNAFPLFESVFLGCSHCVLSEATGAGSRPGHNQQNKTLVTFCPLRTSFSRRRKSVCNTAWVSNTWKDMQLIHKV